MSPSMPSLVKEGIGDSHNIVITKHQDLFYNGQYDINVQAIKTSDCYFRTMVMLSRHGYNSERKLAV